MLLKKILFLKCSFFMLVIDIPCNINCQWPVAVGSVIMGQLFCVDYFNLDLELFNQQLFGLQPRLFSVSLHYKVCIFTAIQFRQKEPSAGARSEKKNYLTKRAFYWGQDLRKKFAASRLISTQEAGSKYGRVLRGPHRVH